MKFDPSKTYTTGFGDKKFPEFRKCSYYHDVDYTRPHTKTRKRADSDFRECMQKVVDACTNPERQRQLHMSMRQRYFIVRKLGWLMWWI